MHFLSLTPYQDVDDLTVGFKLEFGEDVDDWVSFKKFNCTLCTFLLLLILIIVFNNQCTCLAITILNVL